MKSILNLYSLVGCLFLSACITPYKNPYMADLIPESEFETRSEKYSENRKIYDGLIQTMEISTTLLNSEVSQAQLDQKARIYQWNLEQYQTEKNKMSESLNKESKVFLGFFIPDRKSDDLHKQKTLWKMFLDIQGKRYEGKAEKIKTIMADVKSLYPQHNRFYTPYVVTFPVSMKTIESSTIRFTITGPVGSTSVDYKSGDPLNESIQR